MTSVVIIHAGEDTLPARALAEKLRAAKLTPVLEQSSEALRDAVKGAPVTIALWSPRSVAQAGLADDVAFARGKSKVLHACMQNAALPDAFRGDQTVNLTGWRGEDDFPAWRELAKLVTDRAGVKPLPPPAPRPASGFFQPGVVRAEAHVAQPAARQASRSGQSPAPRSAASQRSAPPPRSAPPRATTPPAVAREGGGGGRGMLIGAAVFVVVALVGGGGYWFWSQGQGAQATSAAWEQVDSSDADAIRAFLSGDPGDYREEAQTALAELEERSFEAASDADTIDAFEAFLNDFPESEHAISARGRIAELQTLQPAATDEAGELPPTEGVTDPDLLPPGAGTTTPAPDTSAGPAAITPPADTSEPAPPADLPTN